MTRPVTIEQDILVSFGHTLTRDGTGCYVLEANPKRCGKWGEIPETDWQAADAAAALPVYGPKQRVVSRHHGYGYYPPSTPAPRPDVSVARFSSGATVYRNRNGRCEDAPCCGCCN